MSGTPYNSVLRSGLTRRLWLIISLAMLLLPHVFTDYCIKQPAVLEPVTGRRVVFAGVCQVDIRRFIEAAIGNRHKLRPLVELFGWHRLGGETHALEPVATEVG